MNYNKIIIFAAHPDDEITMARSIAKFTSLGTDVVVVNMTNGCEGYSSAELKDTIVSQRKLEAAKCDQILGIEKRIIMDNPDMGLTDDRNTLKECIRLIRNEKPDAIFSHGPDDIHRDHIYTHQIIEQAFMHAGEPVASNLGRPWKTPYLYYYKGINKGLPKIIFDVTEFRSKYIEALITQQSQYEIFRKTKNDFEMELKILQEDKSKCYDLFYIAEKVTLRDFPLEDLATNNEQGYLYLKYKTII